MKKIVLALSVAAALFAADYNYEITPTVGGVKPEGNLDISDHATFGLRVARNLDTTLLSQVEIGVDYSPVVKFKGAPAGETREGSATRYFANLIKDFKISDAFSIYGLIGAGYEDLTQNFGDNKDDGFGQYGLGLKYNVVDNLFLKLEARDAIKFRNADHNLFYTLGFGVGFGENAKPLPPAPAPVVVPEPEPAPVVIGDEDQDGVLDNVDKCPGTPLGTVVDEFGCEKIIRLSLNFGFDSTKISDEYMEKIKNVSEFLKDYPAYKVVLEGHTDSTGPAAYNKKLSLHRAEVVKKALVDLGVNADRITAEGYGEERPVATNKTKEGRAENRRVDAKFRNR